VRGPLRHRPFALYQGVRLLSVNAVQMMSVAIGWVLYERTNDALSLGLVGLAQFAPLFVLSPLAGDLADRVDRKHILTVCHAAVALVSCALAWLVARPEAGTAPIYAVLVAFGIARAFSGPAAQALVPALVPPGELAPAIALSSTTFQIATITGPALAGLLLAAAGGDTVFWLAAAVEGVVVALLFALRYQPETLRPVGGGIERVLAGVRYVRTHRVILGALSLDLFAVLLGGAVALMPVYARDVLHVGSTGLGLLRAAPAVGAGVVALGLALRPLRGRAGVVMFASVALFGLATVVFGLSTNFGVSLAALAVLGAADMVSVVIRQTVVQITTPPEMRGRVAAVNLVFIGASNELGELESGFTAAWFGVVPAVVVGGLGALAVTALWAWGFPELRRVDRLEDHDADAAT